VNFIIDNHYKGLKAQEQWSGATRGG